MKTSVLLRGLAVTALAVGLSCPVVQAQTKSDTPPKADAPMKVDAPRKADTIKTDAMAHSMDGQVTKVDAKRGWVDVKTAEGSMKLHFPSAALENIKKGDTVTVDLAMTRETSPQADRAPRPTDKPAKTTTR